MLFQIPTPLGIAVRTTNAYWQYLVDKKHPIMRGKEDVVRATLSEPDEIRQSRIDEDVYLFYREFDKLYCVVTRKAEGFGFVVTAYPTDKVKEGELVWKR